MIMRQIAMINPVETYRKDQSILQIVTEIHSEKGTTYLQKCALKWTVVKFAALHIEYSRIWMS